MPRTRRIALLLTVFDEYSRRITEGIGRYAHTLASWDFYVHEGLPRAVREITGWPADGIIGNAIDESLARQLNRTGIPAVYISNRNPRVPLPRVIADDAGVARMAAEHFQDRGFRHFGYVGSPIPEHFGSRLRGETLRQPALEAGGTCSIYSPHLRQGKGPRWEAVQNDLAEWLAGLPRPTAILAFTDYEAWPLAQACRRKGIRVPEEVALLGVTNDEMVCHLASPPLSSIELPLGKLGYEAAALLDRLMRGRAAPRQPLVLAPTQVITRTSSDILALEDPDVVAALRYIREHSNRALRVGQIAEQAAVSKRSLQRKFRLAVGRTVEEEIRRCRIERAKRALIATDLQMPQIAAGSGFIYVHHFDRIFKRATGLTPTEFRKQLRWRR